MLVKFNLTLKWYANTFVNVDAQIEEECRPAISHIRSDIQVYGSQVAVTLGDSVEVV